MKDFHWFVLFSLVLFIIFTPVISGETSRVVFEIPDEVVVSGAVLTLYDLGKVKGVSIETAEQLKKINLGQPPLPGRPRRFTRKYIGLLMQQYTFTRTWMLQMGDEVVVKVPEIRITGTELEQAVVRLVEQHFAEIPPSPSAPPTSIISPVSRRWVELHNVPSEVWVPNGEWVIRAEAVGKIPDLGTVLFKVSITDQRNREQPKTIHLGGKIRVLAKVYRATRDLPRFRELQDDDWEIVELELVYGKELLAGELKTPVRTLKNYRKGEVLRRDQIQTMPLVQKGREVYVIIRQNAWEITIKAIPKSDGWFGDRIMLVNPSSKKSFWGRVIGPNSVEVEL